VAVDGEEKITITMDEKAKPITIKVDKGRRKLEVAKGGFKTFTDEFEIGGGETKPIQVRLEPLRAEVATTEGGGRSTDPHRRVAEFVLERGGEVSVTVDGVPNWDNHKPIRSIADLPSHPFRLFSVAFNGEKAASGTAITDGDLTALSKLCQEIRIGGEFRLATVQITNAGLASLSGTSICSLRLYGTAISNEGLKYLKGIQGLRRVDLNGPKVTDDGMKYLGELLQLDELYLSNVAVGDTGVQDLTPLKKLRALTLAKTGVTDAGIALVSNNHRRLDYLSLPFNTLDDVALEHLSRLPMLSFLDIGSTRITDAGLIHLAKFPSLKAIDVARNKVTSDGLKHIAAAAKLETLGLMGTVVADEGLAHLGTLSELRSLNLRDTAITDAGLKHLYSLKNLKDLNLKSTQVTDEAVKKLQQALPECRIEN